MKIGDEPSETSGTNDPRSKEQHEADVGPLGLTLRTAE